MLDLLAVQGTLKSLLQHHSSKASILRHSAFFTIQLSHPYMTTGKTITLTESESKVAQLCPILCTLWTGAHQAPLSMGFSRQDYWSGVPLPSLMTNLDSVLKSRDITLPTKVHLVKAMVFPVVTYGFENQTIKKAECRRIDAFELWCWRKLLRVLGLQGDPTSPP